MYPCSPGTIKQFNTLRVVSSNRSYLRKIYEKQSVSALILIAYSRSMCPILLLKPICLIFERELSLFLHFIFNRTTQNRQLPYVGTYRPPWLNIETHEFLSEILTSLRHLCLNQAVYWILKSFFNQFLSFRLRIHANFYRYGTYRPGLFIEALRPYTQANFKFYLCKRLRTNDFLVNSTYPASLPSFLIVSFHFNCVTPIYFFNVL